MTPPLHYIAGFFDGEGSIGVYRDGRGRHHLRTQLAQNVTPVSSSLFESFKHRWGGNLSLDHNRKGSCFNWQLNSSTAVRFLMDIHPYLILKKEQALLALMWQGGRPEAGRNEKGHFVTVRDPIDEKVATMLKRLKAEDVSSDELRQLKIELHNWSARDVPLDIWPVKGVAA